MKCKRCGGLTIDVSFLGGTNAIETWAYDGWKCLNCGYVMDPLIQKNKAAQSPSMSGRNVTSNTRGRAQAVAQVAA